MSADYVETLSYDSWSKDIQILLRDADPDKDFLKRFFLNSDPTDCPINEVKLVKNSGGAAQDPISGSNWILLTQNTIDETTALKF